MEDYKEESFLRKKKRCMRKKKRCIDQVPSLNLKTNTTIFSVYGHTAYYET